MPRKMLIDAAHPEETRVVVVDGNRIEEFDFESANKKQLAGNIYLAKVTRVEPSLQAAFVEYGGNRHGFLAFNEIHPDYYQIPVADRQKLLEEEAAAEAEDDDDGEEGETEAEVESVGAEDAREEASRKSRPDRRNYKIQEVIKRRQIILIQVVKEERGNKGAALTTYLSLAGRYCVLMPNTARGGGISRKITNAADRKRLKKIAADLKAPEGMGLIIRTAGANRTKAEIKRDCDYLLRLWDTIRDRTLGSSAPALVHEEGSLIKKSIRDLYSKDIDAVLVEGEGGYREAKDFMKMLMPSHAKHVQPYKNGAPILVRHQVESQLDSMHSPIVQLKSGGYIVLSPTEALVSIDVNSGRSTREHSIEDTALKTNLEAADEVARQLRLRDLAGLIVIDFIDMDENRNNRAVERRMKDALKADRARIQVGRISPFGLLEMSRQRLRPSVLETSTVACAHCKGLGLVRSIDSLALQALRSVEEEGVKGRFGAFVISAPVEVANYIVNEKRAWLRAIEERYDVQVLVRADVAMLDGDFSVEKREPRSPDKGSQEQDAAAAATVETRAEEAAPEVEEEGGRKRRRRRRRRSKRGGEGEAAEARGEETAEADGGESDAGAAEAAAETSDDDAIPARKRPRRSRRGGRGRKADATSLVTSVTEEEAASEPTERAEASEAETAEAPEAPTAEPESQAEATPEMAPEPEPEVVEAPEAEAPEPEAPELETPKPEAEPIAVATVGEAGPAEPELADAPAAEPEAAAPAEPSAPPEPKRRGWWQRRLLGG